APALGPRSGHARRFSPAGRLGIGAEATTGRQMRPRWGPTQPGPPGTPDTRADASLRQGGRAWLASCGGPPGRRGGPLGPTCPRAAGAAQLAHVVRPLPARQRDAWVVAHLPPPGRLAGGQRVAHGWAVPLRPTA